VLGISAAPPDDFTILLLGQTGSGKSSFLNLLANFPSVMRDGQAIVDGQPLKDVRDMRFETDVSDRTVSQTQEATVYSLPMGPVRLRVVDTPGFGDTRGMDIDKHNAKRIVDCVKALGSVHAITLVISGRESRMTAQLKYVLTELCAILPRGARGNILVVFTNTSNPLFLNFDMDALNDLVEHEVAEERQIFIDNPYVLWERGSKNSGKVPNDAIKQGLLQAFAEAAQNLGKFLLAVVNTSRLNTEEFERLYDLRQKIEATTVQALNELENVQREKQELAKHKVEIKRAKNEEEMHKEFTRTFNGKRWLFKDADRHGTFCGVKDCHSNCHAPCIMEKTLENARFKECSAFRYTTTKLELRSTGDRDALCAFMRDKCCPFHTDEDGGTGTDYVTVARAPRAFSFLGHKFLADAMLQVPGATTCTGWSAMCHLENLDDFPRNVYVGDTSDQDTCKRCGHHRKYHYHDNKVWEQEKYTDTVVDNATRQKYLDAKSFRERQQEMLKGVEARIQTIEGVQDRLGGELVKRIRQFEGLGMTRNYALLLRSQKDLLEQHINATLEGDAHADIKALKDARDSLEAKLAVVLEEMGKTKRSNPLEWAFAMLALERSATWADVKRKFEQEALRHHPDKRKEGDCERMQQLNEARSILEKHLKPRHSSGFLFKGFSGA